MLGDKVGLHTVVLTTEWQMLYTPISCNAVEIDADVNWEWRTNPSASKLVFQGIREQITGAGYLCRFDPNEEICEVRGAQAGTLWIKCFR